MSRNRYESKKGIYLSGNGCVICGWNKCDYKGRSLVEGSHVRVFRNIADYDKFDNIIGLCPNHHAEFDAGNIAIDPKRKISIHRNIDDPTHGNKLRGKIEHIKIGYIDYHNKHKFKGRMK
ncbi:MAG: HNH endonuclease [Promethearchaeota archaeon]